MHDANILVLKDLRFGYNEEVVVLNSLSMQIAASSVTAILGPNGTGKTTLLNTILGLLKPQSGEILLKNIPVSKYSQKQLSQMISFVPQMEQVAFNFSVLEYVMLGRTPYMSMFNMPSKNDYRVSNQVLEMLNITHLRNRPVPELSGGEKQLIMLARALAQEPGILLLDEPTAHLDLGNTAVILNILKDLAKKDVTILFTTHDPQAAIYCAKNVVLLVQGQILSAGTIDKILNSEMLSRTYGTDILVEEVRNRKVVLLP